MSTFYERLQAEKIELDEKRRKLLEFLSKENPNVDSVQLGLLRIQECAMRTYSEILAERLMLLNK